MSKVILKRSSVPNKVPQASDLEYGELAINYADGIAYFKRADNTIGTIGGVEGISGQVLLDYIKQVDGTTSGLDADLLDGYHAATTNTGNTVVVRDSSGIISANALKLNAAGTLKDIVWNSTEGTFDMSLLNDVTLQLGQEMHFYVKATENIPDGSLVAFSGAQGNHILASLADLSDPNFKDIYIIGVATQILTANSFGYITSFGKVRTLNTAQWAEGTVLYADPNTVGGLTSTKPQYPNPAISIAAVLRSHSTQGTIFVRPKFNSNLDDLYNVGISSPTTGDLLVYDSTSSSWKNLPTTAITTLDTITAQNITIEGELIATAPVTILGDNVTSIVSENFSIVTAAADINAYREFSLINKNAGSDASADFVAYNNASGAVNLGSYFIDMGINSSNFSSTEYPIFTANSGYLFTAGGPDELNPQPSHLYLGTGTPDSDIVLFAGGTALTDVKGVLKADTGNLLLGTINDDGLNKLQVAGGVNVTGSMNIDGSLYLGGAITQPSQAATKAYVDSAAATGIHIHTPVRVEKHGSWTVTYADGGTQSTITTITSGTTLTTSSAHGLAINDVIYVTNTSNGLTANTPYFVYSVPTTTTFTLSQEYMGEQVVSLTNGTGLSITCKANTGVGATLTNAGAQSSLVVGGVTLNVNDRVAVIRSTDKYQNGIYVVTNTGSASTNWILTRASDSNKYAPHDTNGLSDGDYFYVREGSPGAGESYVITTDTPILFGISDITFTLFSSGVAYTVNAPLNLTGTTLALTGVVGESNGGTGQSTVSQGDLLYGSGTNTWSKLSLGSAYKSLVVNATGTQIEWNAVALNQNAAVSGQLRLVNGGTGANLTAVQGGVVYSTNSALSISPAGISGQVLTSAGASEPTWTTSTSANTAGAIVQRDSSGNFTAGTITATLNGTATQVGHSLAAGTYLIGDTFNGALSSTFAVDATSSNTVSKVVARDASGNFSAGTITANLSGNATTSTSLATPRSIALSTGVTGTATSFDGSANIVIPVTSVSASHLSGSIPSAVLGNSTVYIGTTAIELNRSSNSINLTGVSIDGNAGTVTNGVYTTGSYTDPTWLTISKSKVGLSNVENTALSTWTGSTNITTIGAATATSLVVSGNLTVNGTVTTINSTTISVDDKNIELGSIGTPSDATADGGGITLKGTTDKTFNWVDATDAWTSSEHINLATGKAYYINNVAVLSSNTLGSGITASSLTSVGTITSGTWSGAFGAVSGANLTNLTAGNLSGTISSTVLGNSTVHIGTTAIALNRTSANLGLTGITSIALPGATSGTITITPAATAGTTAITIPATSGTLITTGDTGTVTSTMIADGTIVNADISASAAIAVSKLAANTISGITLGNNLNTLTLNVSGTGLSGSTTYNGSAAATFTVTSNATNANTASAIVARDASGNFSAGTITAALSGNASTATNVVVTDSRNTTTTPETINKGVAFDFKANSAESLTDGGTYFGEMTFRQYGTAADWTGGKSHQLGFTDNDNIWHRSGTSTTWGTWYKLWHSGNDGSGSGLDADLLDGMNATSANTASTVVARDASGNFTAGVVTATDFNATSDISLKENILPAPGLELLNLVNPVQFDWMASGDRSYGVIAQELEKLLPELVHEDEGIKTVSYIPLIAILIKSVQELSSRVKELESNA